ncbi:MAG: DUF2752 domain-containing protein [Chryseolinea sp.]
MNSNRKIYWMMSAILLVGYSWIGFQLSHSSEHQDGFHFCLFKNLTGMPCPSCGITRSIIQFYSGHFEVGLLINPLGLLAAIMLVIVPLWIMYDVTRGAQSMADYYKKTELVLQKKKVYIPLITLLILNWYWNIEKGL